MSKKIKIIGGGLAGVEAAHHLLQRGAEVVLYEMRPKTMTPAHETGDLAELLCSNSLRSFRLENAAGVLKYELMALDSLLLKAAMSNRVPAGFALAVDRKGFSKACELELSRFPAFTKVVAEVEDLTFDEDALIVASGPLSSPKLSAAIQDLLGAKSLYFYDAQAPIVEVESIDKSQVYSASRYQEGPGDYLNCPMNQGQYLNFYQALINADVVPLRSFENLSLFEGCLPVEELAKRGEDALRFGPLKPVGLSDPEGREAYAVVQLRQDNQAGTHYNMTGFQTRLTWPEQKRVFRMIPGMEQAEFVRYGVMHRNSFINAPQFLDYGYRYRKVEQELLFVGQLSGVEGYLEAGASGLLAAGLLASRLKLKPHPLFDRLAESLACGVVPTFFDETLLGSLNRYIVTADPNNFQPSKAAFGLTRPLTAEERGCWRQASGVQSRGRRGRRLLTARRALEHYREYAVIQNVLETGFKHA